MFKRIGITFLILCQLLVACQTDRQHAGAAEKLPPPVQKNGILYGSLLTMLDQLRTDPLLMNARLGYLIVDITSNIPVTIADYNARLLMQPASTLKIFVTGAALEYLGKPVIPEVLITNQNSVNWRSSKLLRKIGGKVFNQATTSAGAKAILEFWGSRGVDTEGMYFYDGNGLSRSNAISPKQLVDALYAMRASSYFNIFYQSLPVAGISGTLHRAMKGSAAEGRVRAKTGTIGSVKSFAGYVTTVSGRKLVFSLIVNGFDCRARLIKKKLESVMIGMAEI